MSDLTFAWTMVVVAALLAGGLVCLNLWIEKMVRAKYPQKRQRERASDERGTTAERGPTEQTIDPDGVPVRRTRTRSGGADGTRRRRSHAHHRQSSDEPESQGPDE